MSSDVKVLANLALSGALQFALDAVGFPADPKLGTIFFKDQCLYAYIKVGGITTWYPFSRPNRSYVQQEPAEKTMWLVEHNLGLPLTSLWFQAQDLNGAVLFGSPTPVDDNSFTVEFSSVQAGSIVVVAPDTVSASTVIANALQVGDVVMDGSGLQVGNVELTPTGVLVNGQPIGSGGSGGAVLPSTEGNLPMMDANGALVDSEIPSGVILRSDAPLEIYDQPVGIYGVPLRVFNSSPSPSTINGGLTVNGDFTASGEHTLNGDLTVNGPITSPASISASAFISNGTITSQSAVIAPVHYVTDNVQLDQDGLHVNLVAVLEDTVYVDGSPVVTEATISNFTGSGGSGGSSGLPFLAVQLNSWMSLTAGDTTDPFASPVFSNLPTGASLVSNSPGAASALGTFAPSTETSAATFTAANTGLYRFDFDLKINNASLYLDQYLWVMVKVGNRILSRPFYANGTLPYTILNEDPVFTNMIITGGDSVEIQICLIGQQGASLLLADTSTITVTRIGSVEALV